MHFVVFEAVSYVDGIIFIVFVANIFAVKLLGQRCLADNHQSSAGKVFKICRKPPMFCLIETANHVEIAVIIEDAIVRWIQKNEVIFCRHVKNFAVVQVENLRTFEQIAVVARDKLRVQIGITPERNVIFPVAVVTNHARISRLVDKKNIRRLPAKSNRDD